MIRETTVQPVSSPPATARRGLVLWSYCRSTIRRPMAIQSGLRFRRRSNRHSVSTMRGAGSSYPSTTLTNGRTLAFHRFRGSRACSAMALFRPAYSRRSKPGSSSWRDGLPRKRVALHQSVDGLKQGAASDTSAPARTVADQLLFHAYLRRSTAPRRHEENSHASAG